MGGWGFDRPVYPSLMKDGRGAGGGGVLGISFIQITGASMNEPFPTYPLQSTYDHQFLENQKRNI
jgi:hypothetical protein